MDPVDQAVSLAVVDLLDRDGRARVTIGVRRWPVTVGRAVDCDVVLDDPHVAPHHAALSQEDGAVLLVVGETVNGVWLEKRRLAAGTGRGRLRIRPRTTSLSSYVELAPLAPSGIRPFSCRIPHA